MLDRRPLKIGERMEFAPGQNALEDSACLVDVLRRHVARFEAGKEGVNMLHDRCRQVFGRSAFRR